MTSIILNSDRNSLNVFCRICRFSPGVLRLLEKESITQGLPGGSKLESEVPIARRSYRALRDGSFEGRFPRHFVPGYDRVVPPGQIAEIRGPKSWLKHPNPPRHEGSPNSRSILATFAISCVNSDHKRQSTRRMRRIQRNGLTTDSSELNLRKKIAADTEKHGRKRRKNNQIGGHAKMGHADQNRP